MNLKIRLAKESDKDQVLSLFKKYLLPDNDALYSQEFFCPFGMKAAIKRGQMLVACAKDTIVAAARFYERKRDRKTSLYQFVIDANYRGKGFLSKMLNLIREYDIVALCPKASDFNSYYRKTGWVLSKKNSDSGKYNHWVLPAKKKYEHKNYWRKRT